MAIDARHLHILLSIAEHGSFSRAAEAEHISQPALSNKIALLEHQLGVRVLDRGRNGAVLNEHGKSLVHHARVIESSLLQAVKEIELSKTGISGPLAIGGTPVSLVQLVPRAMSRMQDAGLKVSTTIIEADDEELVELLRNGKIELLISGGAPWLQFPDFEQQLLREFPVCAVLSSRHALAGAKSVALAALMNEQWILPRDRGAFRQQIEAVFHDAGHALPKNHWDCSSLMAIKSLVMNTNAVAILPRHAFAIEEQRGELASLSIKGMRLKRSVGVMWQRSRHLTPLAERFVQELTRVSKELR